MFLDDWIGLDHLGAINKEHLPSLPQVVVETPREKRIRERQEKHFGIPTGTPSAKVIVHCESFDPVPDLSGHKCPDELSHVIRHGRRLLHVRDRRIDNAPTILRINRVRFRCKHCRMTFDEVLPDINERHFITKRFYKDLTIASLNRPFAEVARRNSLEDDYVENIFHEYRAAMMRDYQADLPRVLAVDETKLLGKARFVCSDLKAGRIIDITDDTRGHIEGCLHKHPYHGNVRVFVQDMSYKYRAIAKELFPYADIVVDRFHVIQRITNSVGDARRAFAHRLPEHLKAALAQDSKLLVTNQSRLSPKRLQLLEEVKHHSPRLKRAHMLKEEFQRIYSYKSQTEAGEALREWAHKLNDKAHRPVDKYFDVARNTTWNDWQREILNFWEHPYTNAFVERMNRSLKEINRYANGLTFETLRDKAILKYGHFHKMKEISNFNLTGSTEEEIAEAIEFRIWKGFSADSLARSLRAGMFEGHPPENRERPVVLPDGKNQDALQAEWDDVERIWEEGPAFEVISAEMAAEYDIPIRRNGIRNAFTDWRLRPHDPRADMPFQPMHMHPKFNPMRHYLKRGRGHGRGRGMVADPPLDPRYGSIFVSPGRHRPTPSVPPPPPRWPLLDLLLDP